MELRENSRNNAWEHFFRVAMIQSKARQQQQDRHNNIHTHDSQESSRVFQVFIYQLLSKLWICEICTWNLAARSAKYTDHRSVLISDDHFFIMYYHHQASVIRLCHHSSSTQFTKFFSAKNQSPTWRPGTYEELYFYGFPAKMIAKSSH